MAKNALTEEQIECALSLAAAATALAGGAVSEFVTRVTRLRLRGELTSEDSVALIFAGSSRVDALPRPR